MEEPAPFLRPPPKGSLTREQIREHYAIETGLAQQLIAASKEQRRALYGRLYDELFRSVPFHPQLQKKQDPAYAERQLRSQIELLRRLYDPTKVFLEIGAGDCALANRIAEHFRMVYAIDVSEQIAGGRPLRDNVRFLLSDGTSIPAPDGSVDIAYSNQLMEHLHPDDAAEQLRNIQRALKPGGIYLCITPNRLSGPHDVSRYFDDVATGFHLKEYTFSELRALFREAGFSDIQVLTGLMGRHRALPGGAVLQVLIEGLLRSLPGGLRRRLASLSPIESALGLVCLSRKSGGGEQGSRGGIRGLGSLRPSLGRPVRLKLRDYSRRRRALRG